MGLKQGSVDSRVGFRGSGPPEAIHNTVYMRTCVFCEKSPNYNFPQIPKGTVNDPKELRLAGILGAAKATSSMFLPECFPITLQPDISWLTISVVTARSLRVPPEESPSLPSLRIMIAKLSGLILTNCFG